MLTSASKHAILVLQHLANTEPDEYHAIADIARRTSSPAPYLAKLVKELSWLGLIESKRGVGGGIRISQKGRESTMFDVCRVMKDPLVKQECVLRNAPCNPKKPCAFHERFKETRENLLGFLRDSSVLDK